MTETSNLSLGALLAQSKKEEAENTRAAAERKAMAESAEEIANFRLVEDFFEKAKTFFESGIRQQVPLKDLKIMVGQEYKGSSDNVKLYSVLRMYSVEGNQPRIVKPTEKYHSLWAAFQNWCARNELEAVWTYDYDGGGMSSWFYLRVQPLKQPADLPFVNPNDVRSQHNYCLHVLYSTNAGLLKAYRVLESLAHTPAAAQAVRELAPLVQAVKKTQQLLDS